MRKNTLPANYMDPPPPKNAMGWGDPDLQAAQNLLLEQRSIEAFAEEFGIVCGAKEATTSKFQEKIEAAIRKTFKFDKGFDLMAVERIVYKLGPELTLMIAQNMGNCVGSSHAKIIACRIAVEIFLMGDAEEPLGEGLLGIPFMPYSYGVGRLAGNMMGGGDGSYCGAQMKGSQEYGFLPCYTEGLDTYGGLPQSSSKIGRLFGKSKAELQKWMDKAKKFDLLEAPVCKTADDAKTLIVDKKVPLQICSGTMPKYWKMDETLGIPLYRMGTPASHSTQIVGMIELKGRWFAVGRNQWGYGAHLGAPTIGIPKGCYVFPIEELAAWLKRAECIGVGSIQGLPQRPLFV